MKIHKTILVGIILTLFSCHKSSDDRKENTSREMSSDTLISKVRLAINPKYHDWVLFKNGTYIIFENADTIPDFRAEAVKQMKEFGPVSAGNPSGDFNVIHLNKTEGWIVSGHGYGMYTYVNPMEMESKNPSDIEVGLYGRNKRNIDGKSCEVLYTNRKE